MKRDVFRAIADPTRRKIIDLLSEEAQSVSQVAAHFPISRPAISKHIKTLEESGLVSIEQDGRQRICRSVPKELREVGRWIDQHRESRGRPLDELKAILLKGKE